MKTSNREEFIYKAVQLHSNSYDYSEVIYLNNKTSVRIKCNKCGKIFNQTPNNHLRNHGCPYCFSLNIGNLKRHSNNIFIERANAIHGYKYNYDDICYVNANTKINIICEKHGTFKQTPSMHLKGRGCHICGLEKRCDSKKKTLNSFIEDAKIMHDEKYDYSLVQYEKSNKKILIICKLHGVFTQTPNNHLNGAGCPKCCESKGEMKIRNYFEKNNIRYLRQMTFNNCKNKKSLFFDFYLPDYDVLIEYDGELHYKSVEYFGGDVGLQYRKYNDNIKNMYVIENNLNLVRISYIDYENIDNILNQLLQ
jgi:hypothetical protein